MDVEITWRYFLTYRVVIFLMQVELATISLLFSSLSRKRPIGISIGLVFVFYVVDLMCRIIPDIEVLKYIFFPNGSRSKEAENSKPTSKTKLWRGGFRFH